MFRYAWIVAGLLAAVVLLLLAPAPSSAARAATKYHYQIRNFTVDLDHFSFADNRTFQMRYLINDSFVRTGDDRNAPILFYTGNEGDIELFAANTGFLWQIAPQLGALVVFAEHRFYGQSLPFGNASFATPAHLGWLSAAQALGDYAALLEHLNPAGVVGPDGLSARKRPVVAMGGSYGGMLAAWMRMKYPNEVTAGALAASAPVLQFTGLTPCARFSQIVTSVFRVAYKPACADNVKRSWSVLKKFADTADGRAQLNRRFNFCPKSSLNKAEDLQQFTDYLTEVYGNLAMANYPYANEFLAPLPAYPVRQFCSQLAAAGQNDTQLLDSLWSALSVYTNYTGQVRCLETASAYDDNMGDAQWAFQTCTDMVMPMCSSVDAGQRDMFPRSEWNFQAYSDECARKFGVRPRVNAAVTQFGGDDLSAASNIIFSNGLLDPWSGGGVLRTTNDRITIVIIPEGAHHLDLRESNAADPMSVVLARQHELNVIQQWIKNY